MTRPRLILIVAASLLVAVLAGCVETPNLPSTTLTSGETITEVVAADRGEPIVFGGQLETEATVSSEQWLGSVVVVNFWYAACPPCRAEAPDLEALYEQFASDGVVFVGVNVRDTAPTAIAFAETFGITYSSIMDANDNLVQLAFAGQIAPNAVPTTVVLDSQGRAAASIIGRIPSRTTLATLIEETLAEDGR